MNTMKGQSTGLELMEPGSPEALIPASGLWPWMAGAVIVVLVVLGLMIFLLRQRKPNAVGGMVVRNAALAEAIAALAMIATEDARDAAVQASLILRSYLSVVAGDRALYETHEQFVARHDALETLSAEVRAAAEAGLSRLAAMKYAPGMAEATVEEVIVESRALLETLHQGLRE